MGDAKRGNNVESSFFEELVKQDIYQGSMKTASYEGGMSKDAAKSMLDSFSADQLEALAEEFDNILGKQASDGNTLEDSILEDGEKLAEEEEKKLPPFMMKGKEKKEEKGEKKEEKGEKKEEDGEKEDEDEKEDKEPKEKEAEEVDEDIVKEAADRALELLEEKNLTLEDYAYSRVQDEKIASIVADKGEKLGVIMGMNPLLVIDDIVNSIEAQISAEE